MSQSNLTVTPDGIRTYSYRTCIKETLPDGRTLGNVTLYSSTTRKHQSKAGVYSCDILLDSVPQGTSCLRDWWQREYPQPYIKDVSGIAYVTKKGHKDITDGLTVWTRYPTAKDIPCDPTPEVTPA